MKSVYLLLTRSHTLLSRAIFRMTGDAWTHVSLALDSNLEQMYSFARKNPHFPLPAGLVREELHRGYFAAHGRMPCMLLRLQVEDNVYGEIHRRLAEMLRRSDEYRYSLLGLMLCRMDFAHRRETHFFCSQFVGKILQDADALRLPRDVSLMRPNDYAAMEGLELVYAGPLCECANAYWRNDICRNGGALYGQCESQPV